MDNHLRMKHLDSVASNPAAYGVPGLSSEDIVPMEDRRNDLARRLTDFKEQSLWALALHSREPARLPTKRDAPI